MTQTLRRPMPAAPLALAMVATVLALMFAAGPTPELLSEAAGVEKGDKQGLGRFVEVAHTIVKPAMFACFAILPLALIGGGALTMIGNQRGPRILGFGVGGAMILAAVSGFAA